MARIAGECSGRIARRQRLLDDRRGFTAPSSAAIFAAA
jgi:hypothetical protein